jgi:transposase
MPQYIHRRNIRFKNEIANANKNRLLGVAIDCSDQFHRVIIFNFLGRIIGEPFSIDTLRKGYDLLVSNIKKASKRISATDTYIAIESTGVYSENIFMHLQDDFQNVIPISPTSTANNRKQKSLIGLKTDDVDCGSIGDLLIRGEFTYPIKESIIYYKLRQLVYWRERKIVMRTMVKNQINDRIKRIYPGINSGYEENKPLYTKTDINILYNGLLEHAMTGQEILKTNEVKLFRMYGYSLYGPGKSQIKTLKKRFYEMLLPDSKISRIHLDIFNRDVKLLNILNQEIELAEQEIIDLGKKTPAILIMNKIKGISDLMASMYIGLIGDIKKYKSAKHIYSKSGLAPKIQQSGSSKGLHYGIKRAGDRMLRGLLFKMASVVIINEDSFKEYYQKIRAEKKRHWKINRIAVCRKLNGNLYALIRDKSEFRR